MPYNSLRWAPVPAWANPNPQTIRFRAPGRTEEIRNSALASRIVSRGPARHRRIWIHPDVPRSPTAPPMGYVDDRARRSRVARLDRNLAQIVETVIATRASIVAMQVSETAPGIPFSLLVLGPEFSTRRKTTAWTRSAESIRWQPTRRILEYSAATRRFRNQFDSVLIPLPMSAIFRPTRPAPRRGKLVQSRVVFAPISSRVSRSRFDGKNLRAHGRIRAKPVGNIQPVRERW